MFRKALQKLILFLVNRIIDRIERRFHIAKIHAFVSDDHKKTIVLACNESVPKEVLSGIPERILGYDIKIKWIN